MYYVPQNKRVSEIHRLLPADSMGARESCLVHSVYASLPTLLQDGHAFSSEFIKYLIRFLENVSKVSKLLLHVHDHAVPDLGQLTLKLRQPHSLSVAWCWS